MKPRSQKENTMNRIKNGSHTPHESMKKRAAMEQQSPHKLLGSAALRFFDLANWSAAVLLVLRLSQAGSQAQITINYNGGIGSPNVVDHTGAVLPDTAAGAGNTVQIGFFDT